MKRRDVLVVGGGIAGLACAALLARAGRRVTVLEAGSSPGGLARTRVRDGFAFNRGAHALYQGGAAAQVLSSLGIRPRGRAPSLRGVAFFDGGRHRLPAGPWSMLTTGLLSMRGRMAVLRLFGGLRGLEGDSGSAAAWVAGFTSDRSARAYLAAMLRLSTYCGDLEAVRADHAVAALRQAALHGVLYLDDGWQQIVQGLVEACERDGVQIRCRAPVVEATPRAVRLRDAQVLEAEHVVLAVPPSVASAWVEVPPLGTARVSCLDVALSRRPDGPGLAFDLDDPMYLSVHSDAASLGPGALVHTLHYGAPSDARPRLEGLLDRTLPGWREMCVHEQFLPSIAVCQGVVPPGPASRPGVHADGLWRVGDAVGDHGGLADAALGSAREVAHAIVSAVEDRAA